MTVASYPFPTRNASLPNPQDIVFTDGFGPPLREYRAMYDRSQGNDAKLSRFQYIGIEEELERSFRYVSPSDDNADAYSLKFAEIIRSAANAYEIMARSLYSKFYNNTDKINIFNYLALDYHLQLSGQMVSHFAALGTFPRHPEVSRPFTKLASWDRASPITNAHIPCWWTAYNEVKHSNDGLKDHATLANAMSTTAALFLLIERVYGFGVLQGGFFRLPTNRPNTN